MTHLKNGWYFDGREETIDGVFRSIVLLYRSDGEAPFYYFEGVDAEFNRIYADCEYKIGLN